MYRKKEQIDQEIDKLMTELNKVAMIDNVISQDENAIITKIREELKNLENQLVQILESELEDNEFNDILIDFLDDCIVKVEKIALEDGIITDDEQQLIKVLKEFVSQRGSLSE